MPNTGKAFEYACISELNQQLEGQDVQIVENQSIISARASFFEENTDSQEEMLTAAQAGLRVVLRHEPQIMNALNNTPLLLSLQEDARGMAGDVRDLLCIRQQNNWEIGISCKHNHSAVKHSRLSPQIDFGHQWFETPCSQQYFNCIRPIFKRLSELKEERTLWRNVPDKDTTVYRPLLEAFIDEMQQLYAQHGEIVASNLISYLIGRRDFYKIIDQTSNRSTHVQAFNIYGTLNRNAGNARTRNLPSTPLPRIIHNVYLKHNSNNTVIIACDNGWQVSLRIHSATRNVEPSLKFDVNLEGVPQDLFRHDESWDQ